MPLFDFRCPECGSVIRDKFFFSFVDSESPQVCEECAGIMVKMPPLVAFRSFEPFWTNNLMRDGSAVYVHDRAQLRELCRREGVRQLDYDPVKEHFGSSPASIPRGGENLKIKRKRSDGCRPVTAKEAEKALEFANRTNFGIAASR